MRAGFPEPNPEVSFWRSPQRTSRPLQHFEHGFLVFALVIHSHFRPARWDQDEHRFWNP
jgi:hypothetical protein